MFVPLESAIEQFKIQNMFLLLGTSISSAPSVLPPIEVHPKQKPTVSGNTQSRLQILNGRTPAQYNMDLLRIQTLAGIG